MNTGVAVVLLLAFFIGIPWAISMFSEGSVRAVSNAVEGSRQRRSEEYRELVSTLPPSRALADISAALTKRGWSCESAGDSSQFHAPDGRQVGVQVVPGSRATRVRVSAPADHVDRASGEVLAALRATDAGARVKAVRS